MTLQTRRQLNELSQELNDYVDYLSDLPILSNKGDHLEYIKTLSRKLIDEHKFVEDLCDIIGGDNAYSRFSKEELIEMLQEMSTAAEEYNDINDDIENRIADYDNEHRYERLGSL